jgi:hypothetical protein
VSAGNCLEVCVNGEFVLDAGICEETPVPLGTDRVVYPPRTTLFNQALAYLRAKPDPPIGILTRRTSQR